MDHLIGDPERLADAQNASAYLSSLLQYNSYTLTLLSRKLIPHDVGKWDSAGPSEDICILEVLHEQTL